MTKYYEYEEYHRRPVRDESPDYYSGGGGPRESRDSMRLELPPANNGRPRSQPPPSTGAVVRRGRSRSSSTSSRNSRRLHLRHRDDDYDDDDRSRDRSRSRGGRRDRSSSPMSKARNVVENNFSNSTTGIGAGLLGAVVGGFAARQASDAASRHRRKSHSGRPGSGGDDDRTRAISTILGAVAGGLGANAIANRVEGARERGREKQHAWEARHGREEDLPHYDTGRPGDMDHRNGRGLKYDSDENDDDYVYDDRRYDDRRPRRRRSDDNYQYRN